MADQYRDRPFPADDDYGRDTRTAPTRQIEGDPLAELARLIGQADPLSTFARDQSPPARHADYDAYEPPASSASGYDDEPVSRPSWVQNLAAARRTQDHPYGDEEHYDPRNADQRQHADRNVQHAPRFDDSGLESLAAAHMRGHPVAGDDRYDDVLYGHPEQDPARQGQYAAQDGQYDDGSYGRPPYDDGLDQEAPRARRGGTMTVIFVLLLAVVGTGAAFAYRTFIGSPRSGEPPVIKADTGPNKIVPAGDGSGKQIYDRVGDKSAERMVSREEQPVDVNAKTGPRVVFPPLTQNANPPSAASASTSVRPTGAGVGNGTLSGGEEPRKIRTLSIRPDQPDSASAATPAARAPQPAAQRAPVPNSTASTGASSNGPVSLAPQAQPSAAAAEPRARVASVNPAAVTSGSYVQVSSQKTEADAQASFRALQSKYSGILGSRTASVRRADLGTKGVFYRAMVGPFGTIDEATQFCVNLKSAGGQCVVQRN